MLANQYVLLDLGYFIVDPLSILMPDLENDAQNSWTIQLIYPEEQNDTFLNQKSLQLSMESDKELIEMPESQLQLMVEDTPPEENQVFIMAEMSGEAKQENKSGSVGTGPFTCSNCTKTYNAKRNLQRHLSVECGKEPKYGCCFCAYKNYRRNEMQNHLKKRHGLMLL
ncbi:hypothetical protein HUJ05_009031 [Dendroctonus ponderosae]|nr:hypothetical protein HUJ05_009031 [Dendroctonus ponderosae]